MWYGQMSPPSCCSLYQEQFEFGEHPRKPTIRNAWSGSNNETWGEVTEYQPRCFQNVNVNDLPVIWRARQAWISCEIFTKCLNFIRKMMKQHNRTILMIVDNRFTQIWKLVKHDNKISSEHHFSFAAA
jgi:hypothetical protein